MANETQAEQSASTIARDELLTHLRQLYLDLLAVFQRDPEQEVLGIALPVLDSVMSAAREHLSASTLGVTAAMVDLISPATAQSGVPVRALDAWLVVGQLLAACGEPSPAHTIERGSDFIH